MRAAVVGVTAVLAVAATGCGRESGPAASDPAAAPVASVPAEPAPTPTVTDAEPAPTTTIEPPPPKPSRTELVAKLKPPIVQRRIALTVERRRDTEDYAERHYGLRRHINPRPHVIVQHVTVTPDVDSVYAIFEANTPDVSLKELPGLCTQFVIGRDGTIYQLTPITFMCRHVVGLNHESIGIEHVGRNDAEVLANAAQMKASYELTRWLRCRFEIGVANVIGHSESLGSRYHEERVARFRTNTHADWSAANMRGYRTELREMGPCPG